MFFLLAANAASNATTVLIAIVGSGGLVGALVAFVKLSGDRGMTAVSQAQGAMETMVELNEVLKSALKECRERCRYYEEEVDGLNRAFNEMKDMYDYAEERWGPFNHTEYGNGHNQEHH